MSTRAIIGYLDDDHSFKSIYLHFGGYPEHTGKILVEHYITMEKIKELLSFGDMSSIGERINPVGKHTFNNPEEGTCVYYSRERGLAYDYYVRVITNYDFDDFCDDNLDLHDYVYLFMDGHWFVVNKDKERMLVTEVLQENEKKG